MTPSLPGNTSVTRAILLSCCRTDSPIRPTLGLQPSPLGRPILVAHFAWVDTPSPICSESSDCMLEPLCTSFRSQGIWPNLASRVLLTRVPPAKSDSVQVLQDRHPQASKIRQSTSVRPNALGSSTLATSGTDSHESQNIDFMQLRTMLSQFPPKCGDPGGLNFQMICSRPSHSQIASRSHSLKHSLNSQAAPTMYAPLSLMIVWSLTRLAMNLVIAIKHASLVSTLTTSMLTPLIVKHVNKQN